MTHEETDAIEACIAAALSRNMGAYTWSVTRGVRSATFSVAHRGADGREDGATNPAGAFNWIINNVNGPHAIILLDTCEQIADSVNLRALRDLIHAVRTSDSLRGSVIFLIDHADRTPPVIGSESVRYEPPALTDAEIEDVMRRTIKALNNDRRERGKPAVDARISRDTLAKMVIALRGLSRRQIRQLLVETCTIDEQLNDGDLKTIQASKRRLLEDAGVLEHVDAPTSLDDIGGLHVLKDWLAKREKAFLNPALTPPRGVLLLGVQGAGKSLASKAIATAWKRPLMRLDPGSLFNKYIGETERNLRDALRQAEAMAPIVLWIDEIEKGFESASNSSNDGGVSRRMFGSLLTWMQDHKSQVFLVATANDIASLPPELMRKGRFDEIFFVDLPSAEVRAVIFRIHIKKRGMDPSLFDLNAMAAGTDGYSGAEIEQAVINATLDAAYEKRPMTTDDIMNAARRSPPLSVTMAERIQSLRKWSKGRCVMAD